MTKKLIVLLLAIAPMVAIAQNNTVAYVNAAEIFSLMPELPGIEEQLTKKQESITKDGEALIAEYNKKAEEFQKTFDTASEATKADQQKQLEQIGERYLERTVAGINENNKTRKTTRNNLLNSVSTRSSL